MGIPRATKPDFTNRLHTQDLSRRLHAWLLRHRETIALSRGFTRLANAFALTYIHLWSAVHPGVAVPRGKLNLPPFILADTYPVPSQKPAAADVSEMDRRVTRISDDQTYLPVLRQRYFRTGALTP